MSQQPENNKDINGEGKPAVKPEPETLNTTDPQEHMEGPISSLMHDTGHKFETDKSKEEADEKKEEGM